MSARRFTALQNLVALAGLAWALLTAYQHDSEGLLEHARRQKPDKRLNFPFYNLLAGWQRLFARAHDIFYHWWRAPAAGADDDQSIDDMFGQPTQLAPA